MLNLNLLKNNCIPYSIFILITLWATPVFPQNIGINSKDSLELDPSIIYGRLNNGFTYYIKQLNSAPTIEMSFWVKAGEFNQTKNQNSIAHLIEHLAFYRTKNYSGFINQSPKFKKYKIKDFKGYTSLTHTIYKIKVPIKSGINGINTGLSWFQNISEMNIPKHDVKKEARILKQEFLSSSESFLDRWLSKSNRESQIFSCDIHDSTLLENFENISTINVQSFYSKWYRPDLMGVAIIGDIKNIESVKEKIKSQFSKIPIHESSIPVCNCTEEYLNSEGRFVIIEKKQNGWIKEKNTPVEVFLNYRKKDPILRQPYSTERLKHSLIWEAISHLVSKRLKTSKINTIITNQSEHEKSILQIKFKENEGKEKEKIQRITQLLVQIHKFGFTPKEWNQIQYSIIQSYTSKTDTCSVSYWDNQLKNHFINHEALPINKLFVIKNILKVMTIEDVNKYITKHFKGIPEDISMLVPPNNKALSYTEFEVREWIQKATEAEIIPFNNPIRTSLPKKVVKKPLMTREGIDNLSPADILKLGFNADTKTNVYRLKNGIRVILDNKASKNNQTGFIQIHGFTPKGANCFPDEDYFSAINAPKIMQNNRHPGSSNVYINNQTSGIKVSGKAHQYEKLFQRIYLSFKPIAPPTKKSFNDWKKKAKNQYFNPTFNLVAADFKEYNQDYLVNNNSIPKGTRRFYGIEITNPKVAHKIYNELFGNASGYTFIITGNYDEDKIISLVQKYLGHLPIQKNESFDCNYNTNKGQVLSTPLYQELYAEDLKPIYNLKSVQYKLFYEHDNQNDFWNWHKRIKLIALSKFIRPRLDNLRFVKKYGLYGIHYCNTEFNKFSKTFSFSIYLACQEDELELLRMECQNIINDIKLNGINQKEFEEVIKNHLLPYYITQLNKKPSSTEIYDYFRFGAPIINNRKQVEFIRSLTPKDIQDFAKAYFITSNRYEYVYKNSKD